MKTGHQNLVVVSSMIACLAGAGCDDTDNDNVADAPSTQEYDDVAKSFGNVVAAGGGGGDVSSIHDAHSLSLGVVPFGFSFDATGEAHGNRLGLSYDYSVTCHDATGVEMTVCDDTTDSASVAVDWSGELSIPPTFMASVVRSGEWNLTGLQGDVATLNGDSSFDFDASFQNDNVSREYHFSYTGTYDGIQIREDHPHVVGGTIRYDIEADARAANADGGTASRTFDIEAVLTFDAQGKATFTLDGSRTYDLNLVNGSVTLHVEKN